MNISKTRKIIECAIMIALATVLSYIKVYELPMGGAITAFSQVPIVIIGYRHGRKWGTFTGFVHGVLQLLLQGLGNFAWVSGLPSYLILIFMDYVLAFTVLGLGGSFFAKAIKNQPVAIGLGAAAASIMRFVCHFISGVTIWGDYADGWSGVWVYSLAYNGSYMLAECIVTIIGTAALAAVVDLQKPNIIRKKQTNNVA